ncbi:hypothetical protein AOA81_05075 [Methanomassiliicoccales archaeon RumEn M2]|nr:hypothetical protein AOA81_05075 [Methanomassiliicoccales archaeon RumEn M2]
MHPELVRYPVEKHDNPGQIPGILQDPEYDVEYQYVWYDQSQHCPQAVVQAGHYYLPRLTSGIPAEIRQGGAYVGIIEIGDQTVEERSSEDHYYEYQPEDACKYRYAC